MYGKNYEQIIHIFRHEFRRFFPCISITVSKYTIPPLASLHPRPVHLNEKGKLRRYNKGTEA